MFQTTNQMRIDETKHMGSTLWVCQAALRDWTSEVPGRLWEGPGSGMGHGSLASHGGTHLGEAKSRWKSMGVPIISPAKNQLQMMECSVNLCEFTGVRKPPLVTQLWHMPCQHVYLHTWPTIFNLQREVFLSIGFQVPKTRKDAKTAWKCAKTGW